MRIAVAGGTGTVGRYVVEAVRRAGDEPVVLARSSGVDLTTGAGLPALLDGVETVIDTSNLTTTSGRRSIGYFEAVTTNLLEAGRAVGVTHHVVLSVVGCDRVGLGYYLGKRRQEQLVTASDAPVSILRATQFHEFAGQLLDRGGPFAIVPRWLAQPIAAREVADALVAVAGAAPAGRLPDLAGPERRWMADLVRSLAAARGSRRPVLSVRVPGAAGRAMASGGLVPDEGASLGRQSFDEWLSAPPA